MRLDSGIEPGTAPNRGAQLNIDALASWAIKTSTKNWCFTAHGHRCQSCTYVCLFVYLRGNISGWLNSGISISLNDSTRDSTRPFVFLLDSCYKEAINQNLRRFCTKPGKYDENARWQNRRPRYKAAAHVPNFDTLVPAPELSLSDAKNNPLIPLEKCATHWIGTTAMEREREWQNSVR